MSQEYCTSCVAALQVSSCAVCYLHRLHLKMPEGFRCSAMFLQLCFLLFLTPTLMVLNRDYLYSYCSSFISSCHFFKIAVKFLRLGRVFLGSLIVSSVCYVRVCFLKSYDPPPFHIEVFDLTPSLLATKNFNDPPQIWPAPST